MGERTQEDLGPLAPCGGRTFAWHAQRMRGSGSALAIFFRTVEGHDA